MTGLVGIYGEEIIRAGQIACQEINENGGVLGRPLKLIIEDDGSLPDTAVPAAEKLIDKHRCSAIIGNLLSNSRIAVAYRVAEPRKVPFLNFSFHEGGIISRYFFHFAALPNQQIDRMIPEMMTRFGKRMYFAGNNYEWPRGSIDAANRAVLRHGGQVAGEEYLPIGVSPEEISALLNRVAESGVEVFVPYFAGLDQVELLTQFTSRGLKEKMAVVMGHYDENMASRLPPEVREGFYSCNTYFMTVDTPENRQFLQRLSNQPGIAGIWPEGNGVMTNFSEGTYVCVKAYAQAVNQAGTLDAEAVIDALSHITLTAPQGKIRMDPETHHAAINAFLTRCEKDGTFSIAERFGSIPPVIPERYRHMGTSAKVTQDEDLRLAARILDYMSEGVILIRVENGGIIYANPGSENMFGYEAGELTGKKINGLIAPSDQSAEETTREINRILYQKGVWKGDIRYLKKDGRPFWSAVSISAFTHAEYGEVWMAVQKDITQQKTAEEKLRDSQEHIAAVVTSAPIGLIAINTEGTVTLCLGSSLTSIGYLESNCVGKNIAQIFPYLPEVQKGFSDCLNGKSPTVDFTMKNRDFELRFSPMLDKRGKVYSVTAVCMDVTEQRKADRLKNEFVSTVSHELRTPLTSIVGSLGLVLGNQIGNITDEIRQILEVSMNNTNRLSLLINDLLDMEKIEAGRMDFHFRAIDINRLIEQSLSNIEPMAQRNQISIGASYLRKPLFVRGDENRLLQVMANLLSNAIKFSSKGKRVDVVLEENRGLTTIRVVDQGKGISDEFRPLIFNKFVQQDSSDNRNQEGTGLGLAISKSILEKHDAVIDFISEPGVGSEFFFSLPVVDPSTYAAEFSDSRQKKTGDWAE